MKILHVLSQFEVTGAEAYAASLIDEQARAGHSAVVASDTFTLPVKALYEPMPIGRRSYPQRLKNIRALVALTRTHSIDLIHAHSRAASWVSLVAARLTNIPLVSTVHGRQHVHISSRAFSVYGNDIIAVSASLKHHLVRDLGIKSERITVIPNCIPFSPLEGANTAGNQPIPDLVLFVGRLTGPKGDVVRRLLTEVLPHVLKQRRVRFEVVGGMITPADLPSLVATLNAQFDKPVVELKGFQKDMFSYIARSALIIGSGRVAPESMALHRPVIAFGESNYVGPLTPESFESSCTTNFGDTGIPSEAAPEQIADDILSVLRNPPSSARLEELARLSRQRFDAGNVARKVQTVYERAYARVHSPHSIPVLMYHRVVEHPPAHPTHGIWVTAEQFGDQLRFLRRRGFETITFRDYDRFLQGHARLPRRPVILTFDDGYEDNLSIAFPLLRKFDCRAVVFVVTDAKRRTNFWDPDEQQADLLTAEQIRELHRAGMEIGSHTITHPRLPQASDETIRRELGESRDALQQILGSEVVSFAYPYGDLNSATKSLVGEAGYKFAVAADSGPFSFFQDLLEIRRIQVFPWTTATGFWKKTLPFYSRYKTIKD
jgi:peptidoglycan/xylan/chitin deacetylase (PgdA/CDA1 family)/glycosyltransferase involved in cell wall biosynthesis